MENLTEEIAALKRMANFRNPPEKYDTPVCLFWPTTKEYQKGKVGKFTWGVTVFETFDQAISFGKGHWGEDAYYYVYHILPEADSRYDTSRSTARGVWTIVHKYYPNYEQCF